MLPGKAHDFPAPMHRLVATFHAPTSTLGDQDGQIRAEGMQGVYVSDARVLRAAELTIDGRAVVGLGWSPSGPDATTFSGIVPGVGDASPDPTIRVERTRAARPDGLVETIIIRSTAAEPVRVAATLRLEPDITPMTVARTGRAAPPVTARADGAGLSWSRDGVHVTATADGAKADPSGCTLTWTVDLHQGAASTQVLTVRVHDRTRLLVAAADPPPWSRPAVTAADPRLGRLVNQALGDLASLRLADVATPDGAFIAAGVPWFLTLFGRDSIWAARMMLPLGTELAEGTLRTLANRQGRRVDPAACEAPGKIMHELRRDDIWAPDADRLSAAEPMVYYGTIDATALWISLLADAWRWGMSDETAAGFMPYLHKALSWLADHSDPTGSGFITYLDKTGRGLSNQGWKDSGTSVRFRDGAMAAAPIALCEVQGYAHRAALDAAALLDAFQDGARADRWREYAGALATRFRERFWVDGPLGPHPALALDRDGRPVDSLTSNIGHLLGTGLLSVAEESQVARLLGSDALAGGHGLRTMSTIDAAYDPMSYHCGSIWPHDTAIALLGLASIGGGAHATAQGALGQSAAGKGVLGPSVLSQDALGQGVGSHGALRQRTPGQRAGGQSVPERGAVGSRTRDPHVRAAAISLVNGLLTAAEAFDYRLPELYSGDARANFPRPLPHPAACRPQAWAATAAIALLQAVLGLDAPAPGMLTATPLGLGEMTVTGLRFGGRPLEVSVDGDGTARIGSPAGVGAGGGDGSGSAAAPRQPTHNGVTEPDA